MPSEHSLLIEDAEPNNRCPITSGPYLLARSTPALELPFGIGRAEIPQSIQTVLDDFGLLETFLSRPPHQQSAYLSWIGGADHQETRDKRMAEMLDELAGLRV